MHYVKFVFLFSHEEPKFINQLRWVHMGYHFDYNVVDYKGKQYFGFPQDLACLTKTIAKLFQFENYIAETGIINYYPEGSSMGGHTDHYEEELAQPLISYSFGQSAIYLIGGQTRDVKPAGIYKTTLKYKPKHFSVNHSQGYNKMFKISYVTKYIQ